MKTVSRAAARRFLIATAAAAVVVVTLLFLTSAPGEERPEDIVLPPVHAGLDYQIGGPYEPPPGVEVVVRDHGVQPAKGRYNVCYVNAFQVQPHAGRSWDADLLLRDADGGVVYDDAWGEALLDLRTADRRERAAAKVGKWTDRCAAKGFQAVEPDNYDSWTRSHKLLDAADAQAFIRLLSARAHARGLAVGQKNTVELAGSAKRNGLDFAVAEECGIHDECGDYAREFDDHVLVVEYTAKGLSKACGRWADRLSVVRRDLDVSRPSDDGYVRRTC